MDWLPGPWPLVSDDEMQVPSSFLLGKNVAWKLGQAGQQIRAGTCKGRDENEKMACLPDFT